MGPKQTLASLQSVGQFSLLILLEVSGGLRLLNLGGFPYSASSVLACLWAGGEAEC